MKLLAAALATCSLLALFPEHAAASSPPHLTTVDPLTQPAPALARPLVLESDDAPSPDAKIVSTLWAKKLAAEPESVIKVVVLLYEPLIADLTEGLDSVQRDELRTQHLTALEQGFSTEASAKGLSAISGLSHLPVVFGEIRSDRLLDLAAIPEVQAIEDERVVHVADVEGGALTNGTALRTQLGGTGNGIGVAVLDTGIDLGHSDFTGRIVAQANTIGGASGQDDVGHGTKVSGIIAGSSFGMAPQGRLWAIKVVDSAGQGTSQSILNGLNAVYANRNQFGGVRAVNMSLSEGGPFNADCDGSFPAEAAAVNQLVGAGIAVVVASGNDGYVSGIGEPSCLANVIAAGAVYDADVGPRSNVPPANCTDATTAADQITCYSNSGVPLDVLAPSDCATTAKLGGGFETCFNGTSAAAPYVAGAAAQIFSLRPQTTPAELRAVLMTTGRPLTGANGVTRDRIDALAAYQALVAGTFCARDASIACLQGDRFEVRLTYRNDQGSGQARVMSFGGQRAENDESVFLSFTSATNFEVGVKVLNACIPLFGNKYWVFVSGLTDQAWTLTIRDTRTGATKTYRNALHHLTSTVADTNAFSCQ